MIIKDLISCGKLTVARMRELQRLDETDSEEYTVLMRRKNALNVLQKYVTGGSWTRSSSREKYIALVTSGFDYKLTAEKFNTTRESLDVFASRQDKRLRERIGEALSLIADDETEEGLICFYASTGVLSERELDYNISALLPKGEKKNSLLVSDCAEEVKILRSVMVTVVRKRLGYADSDKLAHLMFLLSTEDEAYSQQKHQLISELMGGGSAGV